MATKYKRSLELSVAKYIAFAFYQKHFRWQWISYFNRAFNMQINPCLKMSYEVVCVMSYIQNEMGKWLWRKENEKKKMPQPNAGVDLKLQSSHAHQPQTQRVRRSFFSLLPNNIFFSSRYPVDIHPCFD